MGVGWEGKWLAHLLIYAPVVWIYMSGYIIALRRNSTSFASVAVLPSPFNLIQLPKSNFNALI